LPFASFSERVLVKNVTYENEFDLYENESTGETYFQMNAFARRLVLKQSKAKAISAMAYRRPSLSYQK
jgi:hypothetical protein